MAIAAPRTVWMAQLALPEDEAHNGWIGRLVEESMGRLRAGADPRFAAADSPDGADIILFVESPRHKFRDYASALRANELVRRFPERCFTTNYEDDPVGFLPGVYVNMPRDRMDPARFRAGGYLSGIYNESVRSYYDGGGATAAQAATPTRLACFRGSATSARLRETLLGMPWPEGFDVSRSYAWFDHGKDELEAYRDSILDSKFTLCPRGLGTATWRLFESMALGRAPVILSDAWEPPSGPAWGDFSIRVAEDRLAELPAILADYVPYWREMGRRAREEFDRWYEPGVNLVRTLECVEQIRLFRPASHREAALQERWEGLAFAWNRGWTPPQKALTLVREGKLWERVGQKLGRPRTSP